ncbi:MAG: prepilin-type N-terminal cleavage/methylation domain-containing protein [Mariprofundaceae bacterium]
MNYYTFRSESGEKGFTLMEMMVTMVIAMVVLGGLLLSFTQQNSEYKYQNKRIDAVQDLEFAIKFITEDLRSALIDKDSLSSSVTIVNDSTVGVTDPYTDSLDFKVWENASVAALPANKRADRKYLFDEATHELKYDRHYRAGDTPLPILSNVTFFKIFNDGNTGSFPRGAFSSSGIPSAQSSIKVKKPDGTDANVPGYTVLVEIEVDAGYKLGILSDVKGIPSTKKRIWRYAQVYPLTVVD